MWEEKSTENKFCKYLLTFVNVCMLDFSFRTSSISTYLRMAIYWKSKKDKPVAPISTNQTYVYTVDSFVGTTGKGRKWNGSLEFV